MNNLPVFLFVYVDSLVTIGILYIGSYEVSYGYTLAVLSVMSIAMKFVPKQHVSTLESISLVAGVPGCGSNIMHLLLDWELIWTFTLNMDQSPD